MSKEQAAAATPQKAAPSELEVLDEDDEFEEFETEWAEKDEDEEDKQQWEDDWDDQEADDFSRQLRAELQRAAAK
eukprot:m51a1_g11887 hypothetical protein (75) ;mRNA; r:590070-590448